MTTARKEKSKEVVKQDETALAQYDGYAEMDEDGFENQGISDYALPFITMLQGLSPQVLADEDKEGGNRAGQIFNTVTEENYGKEITVIPVYSRHEFVEYKKRENGGGLVAVYQPSDPKILDLLRAGAFGKIEHGENEIIDTYYLYVLVVRGNLTEKAVIPFTGSYIKVYRKWMSKAKMNQIELPNGKVIPAKLFSHSYKLSPVKDAKPKGTFWNWKVEYSGESARESLMPASHPHVLEAREYLKLLKEDTFTIDRGNSTAREQESDVEAEGF